LGGGPSAGNGGYYNSTLTPTDTFATSAVANTGSGGGGNGGSLATKVAGNGGSGIVVIRYPSYLAQAISTTGSPTYYQAGGYNVYIFYASGTITF
jgi:hypothetical protein